MKFEYYEGCSFSTTVDGKELVDCTIDEVKDYVKILIDNVDDAAILQDVFTRIVETMGDEEDLGYCDECGSTNYSYTLDV